MKAPSTTLVLSGNLDAKRGKEIEDSLIALCSAAEETTEKELVLDLEDVTYISSVCLGAVVIAHFECEAKGKRLRVRIASECRQYFEFANLDAILNLDVVE